jgi:hypothetical protein
MVMTKQIFLSYRREESKWQARQIYDALQQSKLYSVFIDIDSIPPGANFRETILAQIERCDVLLALLGVNWISVVNKKLGERKLDDPDDFVRIEIGAALNRGIPVVPVLLDDAILPEKDQLPDDLRGLLDRQAEFVNFRTFATDVKRLMAKLQGVKEKDERPALQRNIFVVAFVIVMVGVLGIWYSSLHPRRVPPTIDEQVDRRPGRVQPTIDGQYVGTPIQTNAGTLPNGRPCLPGPIYPVTLEIMNNHARLVYNPDTRLIFSGPVTEGRAVRLPGRNDSGPGAYLAGVIANGQFDGSTFGLACNADMHLTRIER